MKYAEETFAAIAAAMVETANNLGAEFDACIDLISDLPGKLILTGMGKAGGAAEAVSATLKSTGTRSAFLDPAQALHGDMGIIGYGDGLLAFSNSGETNEVVSVANYCRAHAVPVMVVTSRERSPLALNAEISIIYPIMPEGCPIRRAPMASRHQMLAIGEAMASELMVRRGFTEEDFLALHHGGYLGRIIAEDLSRSPGLSSE